MKKQFRQVSLNIHSLDQAEFFQLVSESKEAIASFAKSTQKEGIYAKKLAEMDLLLAQFKDLLHQSKLSSASKDMDVADQDRDDAFVTMTSLVKSHARVKDAETRAAYEKLRDLFKQYTGLAGLSYEKESEAINHLLSALKEEGYQAASSRLHLTPHINALTQAQKAFDKAYKARLTEQKGKTPQKSKGLRSDLTDAYDLLADFTAIYAAAYPDLVAYKNLHDTLNAIRSRFKAQQGTKKKPKSVTAAPEAASPVVSEETDSPSTSSENI